MSKQKCQICGSPLSDPFEVTTTRGEVTCCNRCREILYKGAKDVGESDFIFEFDVRVFKRSGLSLHVYLAQPQHIAAQLAAFSPSGVE
jgi:predicted nucleic acid-binding Zn ribbon protein